MKDELIQTYDIDPVYAGKNYFVSPLGADMSFFSQYSNGDLPENNRFIISSGNTERDFEVIVRASQKIEFPIKIYCKPASCPKSVVIPKNVELLSGDFPFEQICKDIARSRMVLIPLKPDPQATTGLVSILEALALSKPIIMTKNDKIDIDFDKDHVGLEVKTRNPDEWAQAVSGILNNYALLNEMGQNSFRLGHERFHLNSFVKVLATTLIDAMQK
jgi:glycosyltransferase involved in cell wall biosynthesis